ncbi:MAG: ADOP family duplicated permease [Acidobacteriota bacterium]
MANWTLDLRSALRGLRRSPGFAVMALLLVALSVGANTLLLTWLSAVVLDPLPGVRNVREFVHLSGQVGDRGGLSLVPADLPLLQKSSRSLTDLIAHELEEVALVPGVPGTGGGEPEQLMGGIASGNYFQALGVNAALGRTLLPADDRPEATPVVVLSDVLWRRRFNADPAAVGRVIQLNRQPFTVVGIAPQHFGGTYGGLLQAFWVPISAMEHLHPGGRVFVQIMGRRVPGATLATVRAELPLLAARLREDDPRTNKALDLTVSSLLDSPRGVLSGLVPLVTVLGITAALLLMLAWANLANLLLARGLSRRRDLAVRRALGAGRLDLLRWAASEGMLISVLGGAIGLWIAQAASPFLLALLPIPIPLAFKVGLDPLSCAGAAGLTLVVGGLFALVGAGGDRKLDIAATLKAESGGTVGGQGKTRLRGVLVAVQCSLATVAITGALLMARSAAASARADVGFTRDSAMLATVNPRLSGYDAARSRAFVRSLLERTAAIPGVKSASAATYIPMGPSGGGNGRRAEIEGYTPRPDEVVSVVTDGVGPEYLQTMGMRLLNGRDFSASDQETAPRVAIVNAAFSKHYYGDERAALGRRIKMGDNWHEVVGIVADYTYRHLGGSAEPSLFVPLLQNDPGSFTLVARGTGEGDPRATAALAAAVRAAVRELDVSMPVSAVETLREHTRSMSSIEETLAVLLTACGAFALLLAALGLYAVVAHSVGERRREIGLRMALGANAREVLRMVLKEGCRLAGVGVGAGLLLGLGAAQLLRGQIYGVAPSDALTYVIAALVLGTATVLASLVPALSASRVEPLQALHHE